MRCLLVGSCGFAVLYAGAPIAEKRANSITNYAAEILPKKMISTSNMQWNITKIKTIFQVLFFLRREFDRQIRPYFFPCQSNCIMSS